MARVLVVDDDPDMVRIVTFRLQAKGHRVVGVDSPAAALAEVASRGRPDVVVLDVTMPDMSGLDLLAELRAQPGMDGLPAIFLSAKVTEEDIATGRAAGATYLTKPFIATALLNAIDDAVVPTIEAW